MIKNQRGQALIESLICLPFLISFITFVLIGLLHFSTHYLADYFIYESAICLAQDSVEFCKVELEKKIKEIPFVDFKIFTFQKSRHLIRVVAQVSSVFLYRNTFTETLALPLKAKHFHGAK